jgi:hypothetical protein
MLMLNDGRSELWQWDTGRKLTVDADCSQVHFSNKIFGRSIDMNVVDGVAIIPDVLLQTDKDLNVWAFVGTAENGYTKISKTFKVNRRNKPAGYVFTPPEQTSLGEILERLDDLESMQDPDAIKNAVDDYLANNPIKVKETDPTVPDWAKQPTKPIYTASEVGALPADTVIPTIPDNVSAFRNDAGYLTEHQDISGKLDASALPTAINTALAQAKASGEFDGKDGADGQDGYTPVKGVDYFDGKDGQDGKNGIDGKDGADGYSPVRGTDYWTEADKVEIVEEVLEQVPTGGGDGSGEVWEPILAYITPRPTLVNLGGFEGAGNRAGGKVVISSAGVSKIIFPLGGKFKKILFSINGTNGEALCTAGKVRLAWGAANSNYHNFTEATGTAVWTTHSWVAEFTGSFITCDYGNTRQLTLRNYDDQDFPNTDTLVLSVMTADATFNEAAVEIWGVKA